MNWKKKFRTNVKPIENFLYLCTMETTPVDITVYLVRSQDGKWFRAKGMNGYGDSWVDDVKKARVYTKIGPARSCVTYWTRTYPKFGIPDIVELHSTTGVILNEKERVEKSIDKIKKEKIASELRNKQWRLEQAQRDLADAQNRLKQLKK